MGIEIYQGQVMAYCYEIQKGTKPVALLLVKTIYLKEIINNIKKDGLKVLVKSTNDYPEWSNVYIFKYEYLREVIENAPVKPNSIYDHWVLGKLFGYSDAEIKDFIVKLYDM